MPNPYSPADQAAGYRYDISVLQAEFSLTQVLDKPVSGRIFFDQVLHDNLAIGRPDQVGLVFGRRIIRKGPHATPGRFRTRVITEGVTPSLHVDYKNTKIKQYHKLGKAIRTETTINETRDFGIGKRLTNLPALRQIGFTANRRLLGAQILSHDPIAGAGALAQVTNPVTTPAGTRVAGLRLTDQRSLALLHVLCVFRLLPNGFTNADLRRHLAPLLGKTPDLMTSGQITYDLRRLRLHGLIERIPHTFRYRVTDTGMWITPSLVETRFSPDALVWVTVVFHGTAAWRNHGLIIFPLLFYRTSVQLRCPAAPPGGGLRPSGRPAGGLGISSSGTAHCAAGSPGWSRVTRSVIACDAGGALDLGGGSAAPLPRPAR